jgi:hypothetical protein
MTRKKVIGTDSAQLPGVPPLGSLTLPTRIIIGE